MRGTGWQPQDIIRVSPRASVSILINILRGNHMPSTLKSGKNRKYGRNKAFCIIYKAENRRERNRIRRLKRHLKAQPLDKTAIKALNDKNWSDALNA